MKNKIFVDMDGVIVDLFGELLKLTRKKTLKEIKHRDVFGIMSAVDVGDFFESLPAFKSNVVFFNIIKNFSDQYYICSAPLCDESEPETSKRNRYFIRQSILGKYAWIMKNLKFFPPTRTCFSKNKWKDAPAIERDGTRNILIDDKRSNVEAWIKAGGYAIKFQADEHFDDPDLKFLEKELSKIEKDIKANKSSYNEVIKDCFSHLGN